jgi:hypothetical protein
MAKPFSIFELVAGSGALAPVALIAFFGLRVPQSQVAPPAEPSSLSTASIPPAGSPIVKAPEQRSEQSQDAAAVGSPDPVDPGTAGDKPVLPQPGSAEATGSLPADRPHIAAAWRLGRWRSDDEAGIKQRLIETGLLWEFTDGTAESRTELSEDRVAEAAVAPPPPAQQNQPRPESRNENTFIGGWADDTDECRQSQHHSAPLVISAHAARTAIAKCDFQSVKRAAASRWHIVAQCSREGESWSAHVDLKLAGSSLTWSSERGTATYIRCLKL